MRIGASLVTNETTCPTVQRVLAKLSLCRTHGVGGRKFQCRDCDEISSLCNSCGDHHCPGSSSGKRVDFNEKASKLLLPDVVCYQVVFTLPSELSESALANRKEMTDRLANSSWSSLGENIQTEQGYYLTRYLTAGPISNQRIVAKDRHKVTVLAREEKRVGEERKQVTPSLREFVSRWRLHI